MSFNSLLKQPELKELCPMKISRSERRIVRYGRTTEAQSFAAVAAKEI